MMACLVSLLLKRWSKTLRGNPDDPLIHKTLGIINRNKISADTQQYSLKLLI